jgi:hypothetical protein
MSEEPKFCYSRKTDGPWGGWWVTWENQKVQGGDWSDMVDNCHKLTVSLGKVPPPDISRQIEHALCSRMGGNPNCVPCSKAKQTLGFGAIVRWVRAMYQFAKDNKFELVAQEEAERRAEICAKCPMQIPTSGCWGCKGIAGLLPQIAGAKTTSFDLQLSACGVCGCYNAVSVHLPLSVQQDANLDFPSYCWKKSQSE